MTAGELKDYSDDLSAAQMQALVGWLAELDEPYAAVLLEWATTYQASRKVNNVPWNDPGFQKWLFHVDPRNPSTDLIEALGALQEQASLAPMGD